MKIRGAARGLEKSFQNCHKLKSNRNCKVGLHIDLSKEVTLKAGVTVIVEEQEQVVKLGLG